MADAAEDARLKAEFPLLSDALSKAASQQLRNMASLGGNLLQRTRCAYFRHGAPFACNKRNPGSGYAAIDGANRSHALFGGSDACVAAYPGDFAVALIAMDALIDVAGPRGPRTIPIAELHRQPGTEPQHDATLFSEEIIVQIRGQPIALVLAETLEVAIDATALLQGSYEEQPFAATIDSPLAEPIAQAEAPMRYPLDDISVGDAPSKRLGICRASD